MSNLSWLNPTPHSIAVYASHPPSPVAAQHSLPSGRYSLLGPDFHRPDRTSLRLAHSSDHFIMTRRTRSTQSSLDQFRHGLLQPRCMSGLFKDSAKLARKHEGRQPVHGCPDRHRLLECTVAAASNFGDDIHQILESWPRAADVLGAIGEAAVKHDAEVRRIAGCKTNVGTDQATQACPRIRTLGHHSTFGFIERVEAVTA